MPLEAPWTTCFLTRMLILYLERIGKADAINYADLLSGETYFGQIEDPKAFLTNYNNWVPHHILKKLILTAERIAGTKEVTYLASKNYYQAGTTTGLSLFEIIAKLHGNLKHILQASNLWASGFSNYFKLQCVDCSLPDRSEAILLAQFGPNAEPLTGNFRFFSGNFEGITRFYQDIEEARCIEEISQLKLENLIKEFRNYRVEKGEETISLVEIGSKKEVIIAKPVSLQTKCFPFKVENLPNTEGLILPPKDGEIALLFPEREEKPEQPNEKTKAYEIIRGGTLEMENGPENAPLKLTLREGMFLNAPYSRFRFTWKETASTKAFLPRSEIIFLLFNHVREWRATHQRLLHCAIENKALAEANAALKGTLQRESDFHGIIGKSRKMQTLFEQIEQIGPVDSTVLLFGETGTGKELFAKAIHQSSSRRDRRFYAVNCAALNENLLEAELFGYEKGAFTGAFSQKKGIFETASGGTLFLDEVGEISPTMQAKLLRVLEEGEIQRIGGRETIPVDVRVISATHRDLKKEIACEKFRSDLFYRLHVISLVIPPLRERLDDLPLLVDHYLDFFSRKCKKEKPAMTREALSLLTGYDWPGNVRQLKNVIERAVVLDRDRVIHPDDIILPEEENVPEKPSSSGAEQGFHEALDRYKRLVIEEALQKTGGNQTKAAERLGIQRTYLARLIRTMKVSTKE
ncbi:MAG: sigma-54 dependent transcriptional regulator [Candidatus Manganitrophaceae bacterium]